MFLELGYLGGKLSTTQAPSTTITYFRTDYKHYSTPYKHYKH